MTALNSKKKRRQGGGRFTAISLSVFFTAAIFASAIYLSKELSELVAYGLELSVKVIIPSIFPFLILTDFSMRFVRFEKIGFMKRGFERIFKINGSALPIFICGLLAGFPVGANLSITAYRRGIISKGECERLLALANNASPGYVISGIGMAMRGSIRDGIILYTAMVAAAVGAGWIAGLKDNYIENSGFIIEQKYSFTESVKHSAEVCINVCAFITTFSVLSGILKKLIRNQAALAVLLAVFELGNAGVFLSDLCVYERAFTLSLTAFSISFSGLCVYAQAASLLPKSGEISGKRYLPIKLLEGILAALFSLLFDLI